MKKLFHLSVTTVVLLLLGVFVLSRNGYATIFADGKGFKFSLLFNQYLPLIISGYIKTIVICLFTIIFSFILGWVLFALQRVPKSLLFIKYLTDVLIQLVVSTPLIVVIIIGYYFIAPAFELNDPVTIGILILSIYSGVYIHQIYEASVASILPSQIESAKMLGMTRFQLYYHVILPQMMQNALPPLIGQVSGVIKNSALLSYVAISEFTNVMNQIKANSFIIFESYLILALGYLLITVPLIYLSQVMERRFRRES